MATQSKNDSVRTRVKVQWIICYYFKKRPPAIAEGKIDGSFMYVWVGKNTSHTDTLWLNEAAGSYVYNGAYGYKTDCA